jgi:hypothetical protein
VAHRRDDRDGLAQAQPLADRVGVITFVRDQFAGGRKTTDALLGDGNIRDITGG